jgi:hypothetical protein
VLLKRPSRAGGTWEINTEKATHVHGNRANHRGRPSGRGVANAHGMLVQRVSSMRGILHTHGALVSTLNWATTPRSNWCECSWLDAYARSCAAHELIKSGILVDFIVIIKKSYACIYHTWVLIRDYFFLTLNNRRCGWSLGTLHLSCPINLGLSCACATSCMQCHVWAFQHI